MDAIRGMTALRASAIAVTTGVSAAALLLAGSGTAAAQANPITFANEAGTLQVIYGGDAFNLFATIVDAGNPAGVTELCHYRAAGVTGNLSLPHENNAWVTGPNPSSPMWIMVPQWGQSWSVTVTCSGTGNTASSTVVY